nr:hypothetical protein [Tanacetum cinerariifolium]
MGLKLILATLDGLDVGLLGDVIGIGYSEKEQIKAKTDKTEHGLDPYEAIRQACLVEADTEFEPFEDPVETETPESPHTVASPTSLPDSKPPTCHAEESEDFDMFGARSTSLDSTASLSPDQPLTHTSPTLVPFTRTTARMAVHVLPLMSPGLSASIAEAESMFHSAFRKRFRSSYETSPSSSPPELPLRKRSREDDGPTAKDEGPAVGDEGLAARDEGPGMRVRSLGLGGDEAVPEGQQRAALVMKTAVCEPLGLGYEELRRQEIASREGQMPSVFEVGQGSGFVPEPERPKTPPVQTPQSPKWSSGSLHVSPAPSTVPLPISSPMISLTVSSPVASPATAKVEGFLTELGAQRYDMDIEKLFTRSEAVKDEIFSQRYRLRSLEHKHERVLVTFGAIWRPVLALESCVEERRVRLDLAEIIASMRKG